MAIIQRLNYHTGLFLRDIEFNLEQNYHMLMRRRLNYALFRPGALYGLGFHYTVSKLFITPGMAIDESKEGGVKIGREIIIEPVSTTDSDSSDYDATHILTGIADGTDVWITISYKEEATDRTPPTEEFSRMTESFIIESHETEPGVEERKAKILIGKIRKGEASSQPEASQMATLRLGGGVPVSEPVIAGISPDTGNQGTTIIGIEITGTYFTGATDVLFDPPSGLTVSNFLVVDDEHITFNLEIAPAAPATVRNFRVHTPGGTALSEDSGVSFTVNEAVSVPKPVIAGISPDTGNQGATITGIEITGTHFTGASFVSFDPPYGLTVSNLSVVNDTRIRFDLEIAPEAAPTPRNFRVTTPGGTALSEETGVHFSITQTQILQSITISVDRIALPASGATAQFTATGHYSAGPDEDITDQVSWDSSNSTIASINSEGLATSGVAGTADITATATVEEITSNVITLIVGIPIIHQWPSDADRRRNGTETLTIYGDRFCEPLQVAFPNVTIGVPDVIVTGTVNSLTEAEVVVPGPFAPTASNPAVVRSGQIKVITPAGESLPSPQAFVLETT